FERFRQADTGSTRRYAGLGIGLSLVKHLVELHGGTVTAASAGVGQGATFTVTLPVSLLHGLPETAPTHTRWGEPIDTDSVKPISLRDLRVLVVDDDGEGRELAALILTNA